MKKKLTEHSNGYNEILEGENFYVSYHPDTTAQPISPFLAIAFSSGENGGEETALCYDSQYLILLGDHRKEYQKRLDSLEACKEYFYQNQLLRSEWSTD